jgi:hypothetical protein
MNINKTILSLCDITGEWPRPYREAGYNVISIDLKSGGDVRLMEFPGAVHGILAAPPCTHLAVSGARWWADKGEAALLEALAVADACLRLVALCRPKWWALENPIGRLSKFYGTPAFMFDPCEFGTLSDESEAYTKRTCLWGDFTPPMPAFVGELTAVEPVEGSRMHMLPPSPERAALRSVTPSGFARAFYRCNP